MALSRTILLCTTLALAGCGGGLANSWVNPGNWFGRSNSQAIDNTGSVNPLIPRPRFGARPKVAYSGEPVDQIKSLRIERKPGGAILHVVGVADAIGYYDVRLRPDSEEGAVDGVLSFTLRAERPETLIRGANEASRQIVAARLLSDQDLDGVRSIVVKGARNQRTTRRR